MRQEEIPVVFFILIKIRQIYKITFILFKTFYKIQHLNDT